MGRFFSDFDEAWEYFLARSDPLEWFFGDFPEEDALVAEAWVVVPSDEIKRAALDIQRALARFHWLAPIPEGFLHVALGLTDALGERPRKMRGSGAFEAAYRRVNCFHSAVVVEVRAPRLRELVAGTQMNVSTFLPHMTVAVTREQHDPRELRTALTPLRSLDLGKTEVKELTRVRFPAARTTLLQPWTVLETVPLA